MAGEDGDTELRDIVAQTLETQGILGKIRAQLRASVFLALEQDKKDKPSEGPNDRFNSFMQTEDGRLTASLVREFLQFFDLDFTCSVFDPETDVLRYYKGRDRLATDAGLSSSTNSPLLLQLLKRARSTPPPPPVTMETTTPTPVPSLSNVKATLPPLTSELATPPSLPPITLAPISLPNTTSINSTGGFLGATPTPNMAGDSSLLIDLTKSLTQVSSSPLHVSGSIMSSTITTITPVEPTVHHSNTGAGGSLDTKPDGATGKPQKTKESQDNSDRESDDDTVPSQKWETTDHSLSPTSASTLEEFDYTERVQ